MLDSMLQKSKTTIGIQKTRQNGASVLLIRQTGKCLKHVITNQLLFSGKHEHCGLFKTLCGSGNVSTQLCFWSARSFPEKVFGTSLSKVPSDS